MATFWVSEATGDDLQDGTTFALAKKTIKEGTLLCTAKGDILNLVNDGDHVWPTSETDFVAGSTGTSFSDFGILVRGVTSTEVPALTSVVSSGADAIHRVWRQVANTGFNIIRNIEFDSTPTPTHTNAYSVVRTRDTGSPDPLPVRFEGCSFLGTATGITASGTRRIFDIHSVSPPAGTELCQVQNCYIQNVDDVLMIAGATVDKTITGSVILIDSATSGPTHVSQVLSAGSGGELIFTSNTVYVSIGATLLGIPLVYNVGGALNAGVVTVQNNLLYIESSNVSAVARFLVDSIDDPGASMTDTIDFNVFLGGTNISIGDLHADGWYSGLFNISPANDQQDFNVAETTIFNAPSSTFAWDATGNGVTITILKDLRPILFQSASSSGGVIGALPAATTDFTVTTTADSEVPETGDSIDIFVKVANSGADTTALVLSIPIVAGTTYVSDIPDTGSYDDSTGLWTIGVLASGANTTLSITMTIDSDQGGKSIIYTGSISSSEPAAGPPTADDTSSVTLVVVDDTSTTDPDSPAAAPFIDVLPLIAPDLKLEMFVRTEMIQSRVREVYERGDFENKFWSEFTSKRLVVATNTTIEVNLGGVERGEYMVLDATTTVDVSAVKGGTQRYWTGVKTLVIARGDFERVHIRNNSTTLKSTILVGVTD